MEGLSWKTDRRDVLEEISGGTRLLMMFFYRPECEGSEKMINETFRDENVLRVIERETAPVICNISEQNEMAKKFHVDWTPAFVITDEEGNELERWVGFLPPQDFIPQLLLSKGLAAFHLNRLEESILLLEELVDEYPHSELVPEAEYFLGAANFRKTGETEKLAEVCHSLMITHPESPWTKRCSIWSRLKSADNPFTGYFSAGGSLGSGAY